MQNYILYTSTSRSFDILLISLNELLYMGITSITKGVTTIREVITTSRILGN